MLGELFGKTVTRHFRQKSGHSNDRLHCKPTDRTLKKLRNGAWGSFLLPLLLIYGSSSMDQMDKMKKRKHIYG